MSPGPSSHAPPLPSPAFIRGALQLQPAERSAAQRNTLHLVGEDAPESTRLVFFFTLSPDRTPPRRDETLPGCRDRGGPADRCVGAAWCACCQFQHLGSDASTLFSPLQKISRFQSGKTGREKTWYGFSSVCADHLTLCGSIVQRLDFVCCR